MIFRIFYGTLLHLIAIPVIFKMFYEMIRTGKYRKSFLPKLGFGFPKVEKRNRKLIWIHAVSLGETKAILPLLQKLKNEESCILLSAGTETGYEEGKGAADYHVYLPFDLGYIIRPIVKRIQPDLILVTETDFWFNFQDAAKKSGARLMLVNGKLSETSLARYKKFPFFAKKLLHPFDLLLLQGRLYADRFRQLGIPNGKVKVTGNLKLDGVQENAVLFTREKLQMDQESILTLGSTHDPEEKLWVAALNRIWREVPDLKVFLVPRHPQRFDSIAQLLLDEQIPFHRFSQNPYFGEKRVLLIDVMGLLRSCYQISTLAFVGGSLTKKVGGHNILEPAYYGVPVLFGPFMYGQPDFFDLIKRYQAGICVRYNLVKEILELLKNGEKRGLMGERGKRMIEESQGSLEETLREIHMAC